MAAKKYFSDPVEVSLDGRKFWIQFKRPTGIIPGIGPFEAAALVKREKQLLEELNAIKDEVQKQNIQSQLVLPGLLANYVDGEQKSSSLFDFVGDPKEKKRSLNEIIKTEAALQAEVDELKNAVAALEAEKEALAAELAALKGEDTPEKK